MESYIILAIFSIIILTIILGILLACIFAGQGCTLSIQQRVPNHELTQIQLENERKQQQKFSSKLKRAFSGSSKSEQPLRPVEDVRTIELTVKLDDDEKDTEQITTINEPETVFVPKTCSTQAERDRRAKRREELRKKYNL
ncbi:hypothetical protein I4U23_007812 [Adineta vaga]|nr:hypothetical protein I4U23_007812 [Adineta vaga]